MSFQPLLCMKSRNNSRSGIVSGQAEGELAGIAKQVGAFLKPGYIEHHSLHDINKLSQHNPNIKNQSVLGGAQTRDLMRVRHIHTKPSCV